MSSVVEISTTKTDEQFRERAELIKRAIARSVCEEAHRGSDIHQFLCDLVQGFRAVGSKAATEGMRLYLAYITGNENSEYAERALNGRS
jgi:hypothetical protein